MWGAMCILTLFTTCVPAEPVTDWVVTNGSKNALNANSSNPIFTGSNISVMGNWGYPVALNDGEAISFTGSLLLTQGAFYDVQVRIGLFNGPQPARTGVGSGYEGIFTAIKSNANSRNAFTVGKPDPFAYDASLDIGKNILSTPLGPAPAKIPLDFELKLTRNGSNWDFFASFDNRAHGGDFFSSGERNGVRIAQFDASVESFNSAGVLFGSGLPDAQVQIINANIARIPEPQHLSVIAGLAVLAGLASRSRRLVS